MQDAIRNAYALGQFEWPELAEVSLADFERHVRSLDVRLEDLATNGADVYLALACASNDPAGLEILERRFFGALDEFLTKSGFSEPIRQDVLQQVLIHLCTEESPPILTYAGRSSLDSWLQATMVRFAVELAQSTEQADARQDNEQALRQLLDNTPDPKLQATLDRARPALQDAMVEAMGALQDRDKTLLKLSFVEGLSIDSIGDRYGVQRTMVAGWIADIRHRILEAARALLASQHGLRELEFASLVLLLRGDLHSSLLRVFGAA